MKKLFDIERLGEKGIRFVSRFQERIAQDQKKLAVFLACVITIICLDLAFLLGPQIGSLRNLGKDISKIALDRQSLNRSLSLMQDFQQKQMTAGAGRILPKKTFSKEEQPVLLELISTIANESNLRLMQINAAGDAKSKDPDAKDHVPGGKFTGLLINLEISGDYHALGRYLNELEDTIANFTVSSIRIVSDPKDFYRQNITLALKVYVKK